MLLLSSERRWNCCRSGAERRCPATADKIRTNSYVDQTRLPHSSTRTHLTLHRSLVSFAQSLEVHPESLLWQMPQKCWHLTTLHFTIQFFTEKALPVRVLHHAFVSHTLSNNRLEITERDGSAARSIKKTLRHHAGIIALQNVHRMVKVDFVNQTIIVSIRNEKEQRFLYLGNIIGHGVAKCSE